MNLHNPTSLDNLHSIVEPEAVSLWWPLAPGWWVVIAIVFLTSAIGIWRAVRIHRKNAYRRDALAEIDTAGGNPLVLPSLLKRVALSAYPRSEVAGLTGHHWIAFLNREAPDCFDDATATDLLSLTYAEGFDKKCSDGLATACRRWIIQHQARKEGKP